MVKLRNGRPYSRKVVSISLAAIFIALTAGLSVWAATNKGGEKTTDTAIKHVAVVAKKAAADTSTSGFDATKPSTPVTSAPLAGVVQNVQKIPEIGIKMDVPDELADLTYVTRQVDLSNGKTATAVLFSTKQLAASDPKCTAEHAPLGAFTLGKGQYPKDDENVGLDYGRLLEQYPDSFVGYSKAQGGCSTDADAIKIGAKAETLFKSILKTIEQTK